jgi:hypothetical protein
MYTTTLYVLVDIVKGGGCGVDPQPHQPGLIFPSWWNVRQKVAVATLCALWILPPSLQNIEWLSLYISLWCKTQLFFFCSAMWIYFKYQLAYLPQLHMATFPCSPLCPFLCGPPSVHTCGRAWRAKNPPDVLAVEIGKSGIINYKLYCRCRTVPFDII